MSVLLGRDTRVLVQGMGREGTFHATRMREYGTKVVGGVVPGAGGTTREGFPIFDTVSRATIETAANASIIFVPASGAMDAMLEALDAELDLVIAITEGTPVQDMLKVASVLDRAATTLIGPNCPGAITPGECKIGIMPAENFKPGPVGFVSRSGTLTYEIADLLSRAGLGQSTCLGIGGDPVIGLPTPAAVRLLNEDPATEVIVIVGEIGGSAEESAAEYMLRYLQKKIGIPDDKFAVHLEHCGNTVSSTIPIVLQHLVKEGQVKRDDLLLTLGFGVGYSWGANLIRWSPDR